MIGPLEADAHAQSLHTTSPTHKSPSLAVDPPTRSFRAICHL